MEKKHDEEMARRLKSFRIRFIAKKQSDAIEKIGLPQSVLSKAENAMNPISMELVSVLITNYQLNIHWLLTGQGAAQDKKEKKSTITTDLSSLKGDIDVILKGIKFLEKNQSFLIRKLSDENNRLNERITAIEQLMAQKQAVN